MLCFNQILDSGKITFNAHDHTYSSNNGTLSGITKVLSDYLKMRYSGFASAQMEHGTLVHNQVEEYIKFHKYPSTKEAIWVLEMLFDHYSEGFVYSEVLVSDFNVYASAIDILVVSGEDVHLIDIKTGVLHTQYIQVQLSMYCRMLKITFPFLKTHKPSVFVYGTKKRKVLETSLCSDKMLDAVFYSSEG